MIVLEVAGLVFLGCLLVLLVEAAKGLLETKEAREERLEMEEWNRIMKNQGSDE